MAVIMNVNYGGSSGEYLTKDAVTNANVRADHTIMCRAKWSVTTNNQDLYPALMLTSAGTSGSFVGRVGTLDGAGAATLTRGGRRSTTPTYNSVSNSGSFGDTTTWRHYALTYNASTQVIEYFIDGVSIGTVSSTTTFVGSDTAGAIGIITKGKVADFAVYNRVLSSGEVAQMAAARALSVTSSCICFCRMDTNQSGGTGSGTAADTSGSANHLPVVALGGGTTVSYSTADNPPQPDYLLTTSGLSSASTLAGTLVVSHALAGSATSASTLSGSAVQSQSLVGGATSASTLAGTARQSQALAGSTSSATTLAAWIRPRWGRRIASSAAADLTRSGASVSAGSSWTLMVWFKTVNSSSEHRIGWVSDGVTVGSNGGDLRIRLFDSSATFVINYSAADDLQWHHLALTFDGTTGRGYVDGTQVASAAASLSGTFVDISLDALSGGSGVAEAAHLKIWSGAALTAAEISQEKDFYTPAHQTSSLYGWWQLGWQNVTLDSSGNGRTLTDNGSLEAQTESPGLPLTDLAGSATSASTLSGTVSQSVELAGAATSASTLSAVLVQSQALAGASTSASTLAGTMVQDYALAGSATSGSALSGEVTQTQALVGAAASASTLAGSMVQNYAVAGTAASASTLAGAMVQDYAITGSATSASTLAGTLNTVKPLSGDASSASALGGALIQEQVLVGESTSASTFPAAALGIQGEFVGSATSASTLTGALNTEKPVAGDMSSASTLPPAALNTEKPLAGDLVSASTLDGTLSQPVPLAGETTSASALAGALNTEKPLAVDTQSASTLAGALLQDQAISGLLASASALAADMLAILSGASASASTLTGTVDSLGPRELAGNVTSASTLNATLSGGGAVGGSGGRGQNALRRMSALVAGRRPVR